MNPELDLLMDGLLTAIGSGDYGQETDALRDYLAARDAKLRELAERWKTWSSVRHDDPVLASSVVKLCARDLEALL